MSSVGARIAARLPVTLRSAAARIGAGIRSVTPRIAGAARQAGSAVARAVRSPAGKVALGAVAVGGGIGLGSYLALSGLSAGQAYGQYATEQALTGEPPPAPPPLPWGQDFLAQPPDQGLGLAPAQPFGYLSILYLRCDEVCETRQVCENSEILSILYLRCGLHAAASPRQM